MKRMWAPWRMNFIQENHKKDLQKKEGKSTGCVFCDVLVAQNDEKNLILHRGKYCFIILNKYPYNPGHIMVIPNTHTSCFENLTDSEMLETQQLISKCLQALKVDRDPGGFNLGVNIGRSGGAGIPDHLHHHIVPRWNGDTNFMPAIADTKVLPETVEQTYQRLHKAIQPFL